MLTTYIEFIKSLFGEKRETLFAILILAMLAFAINFLYTQLNNEQDNSQEDIKELKAQHIEEIKAMRQYQIESDIQYQKDLSACTRDKRIAIDSIEEYYFNKVKELRLSIKRIKNKVELINK